MCVESIRDFFSQIYLRRLCGDFFDRLEKLSEKRRGKMLVESGFIRPRLVPEKERFVLDGLVNVVIYTARFVTRIRDDF